MVHKTDKYLLTDVNHLRRIKFAQFRSQIPALIILVLAIIMNSIFPNNNRLYYDVALIIAILAIAAYIIVGLCYRYRQRIPIPPENAIVSPVQGKIAYIRRIDDNTLINIRKSLFDRVEFRSPHSSAYLENGVVQFETPAGKAYIRLNFKRPYWFSEPDFTTGNLIGMVTGSGSCTISLPGKVSLNFQAGDNIDAGEPLWEDINSLNYDSSSSPYERVNL